MTSDDINQVILKNTAFFADCVCKAIKDMAEIEYKTFSEVKVSKEVSLDYNYLIILPFSGKIQGNFYISLEEILAARMAGIYREGISKAELMTLRSEYSSFLFEIINVSGSKTIPNIELSFAPISLFPPYVIYGSADMPNVYCGSTKISNPIGLTQCALSIDQSQAYVSAPVFTNMDLETLSKIGLKERIALNKYLSSIEESIKIIDEKLKVSKVDYLSGATQHLQKHLHKLAEVGILNMQSEALLAEFQLLESGIKSDEQALRNALVELQSRLLSVRDLLVTSLGHK